MIHSGFGGKAKKRANPHFFKKRANPPHFCRFEIFAKMIFELLVFVLERKGIFG
jgi:hypothetical protein